MNFFLILLRILGFTKSMTSRTNNPVWFNSISTRISPHTICLSRRERGKEELSIPWIRYDTRKEGRNNL
jgi:hypothetical protein